MPVYGNSVRETCSFYTRVYIKKKKKRRYDFIYFFFLFYPSIDTRVYTRRVWAISLPPPAHPPIVIPTPSVPTPTYTLLLLRAFLRVRFFFHFLPTRVLLWRFTTRSRLTGGGIDVVDRSRRRRRRRSHQPRFRLTTHNVFVNRTNPTCVWHRIIIY